MELVCHLINKIYREMLYITRHEGMTIITMGGLDHVQVSAFTYTSEYRIVLSWDLLAWISVEDRIPCSFAQIQSYLVPCISARVFIIPKLRNIHWRQFF